MDDRIRRPVGGKQILPWNAPRDEWLAARLNYITASNVPDLYGVGYGDAFSLWAIKTRRHDDSKDSIDMRRGLDLEDAMIKHWIANYAEFRIQIWRSGLIVSKRSPRVAATLDRRSRCDLLPESGGWWCTVEGKTNIDTSGWGTQYEPDVPVAPMFQGQCGLGVSGAHHTHFVVMGPRFRPFHRIMYRDEQLIDKIFRDAEDFWERYVVADVPPPATSKSDGIITALYSDTADNELEYVLTDEDCAMMREAIALHSRTKIDEKRLKDLKAALKAKAGNATRLVWPNSGETAATWRQSRVQIDGDNAAWKLEHPDLVNEYGTPRTVWDVDKGRIAVDYGDQLTERTGLSRRRTFLIKGAKETADE